MNTKNVGKPLRLPTFLRGGCKFHQGVLKYATLIKNVGNEEEEYAAGGGIERTSIGWNGVCVVPGKVASEPFPDSGTRKRRYVLSRAIIAFVAGS